MGTPDPPIVSAVPPHREPARMRDLLVQHSGALRAYLRLHMDPLLRQRESCSDMVQSVFCECLGELERFDFRHEAAFRKWLYQKALSKIVDRRRYWLADKRNPDRSVDAAIDALPAQTASVSGLAIGAEDLGALEKCFAELPDDYRHVIAAAKLIGQTHAEIAADTGRSAEAVGMLLHRALARLGTLMKRHGARDG